MKLEKRNEKKLGPTKGFNLGPQKCKAKASPTALLFSKE